MSHNPSTPIVSYSTMLGLSLKAAPFKLSFDLGLGLTTTRDYRIERSEDAFKLEPSRIVEGRDQRTTVMIKNIPNKYTQKMLLERLDVRHAGRYDFFYLPIDLKNNCNVGYAFINMSDPIYIVPLFKDLSGKKWERFNSEKICVLTYGRIQGKEKLVDNFQAAVDLRKVKPAVFTTSRCPQRERDEIVAAYRHD